MSAKSGHARSQSHALKRLILGQNAFPATALLAPEPSQCFVELFLILPTHHARLAVGTPVLCMLAMYRMSHRAGAKA